MAAKFIVLTVFISIAIAELRIRAMKNLDLCGGNKNGTKGDEALCQDKKLKLWPNGIIPYYFDKKFTYKKQVLQAMKSIEDNTCIKFQEFDGTQTDVVRIQHGEDCRSVLGKAGGTQLLSLAVGCGYSALHELLHSMGFDHEQNRPDRDDYLTICWQNIKEGFKHQFKKLCPNSTPLTDKLDFSSIMLYDDTEFSADGKSKTMVAKKPGVTWPSPENKKNILSPNDIKRINIVYGCKKQMV